MVRTLNAMRFVATSTSLTVGALLLLTAASVARAETDDERSLWGAAWDGRTGEVERLLAKGTNPNVPDHNGRTAVHHAALKANGVILRVLLEAGGNPNAVDRDGFAPLHFAADFEFEPDSQVAIRVLLDHDANPDRANNAGQTPLHFAARRHHSDLSIFHLLDAGAGPNRPDGRGDTPLHYAVDRYSRFSGAVVEALVDRGADGNRAADDGEAPLQRFARVGTNSGRIVAALVDGGADPNQKNPAGETPLHTTIRNGGNAEHPRAVEALLHLGADPCIKDAVGYIPYNTAREGGTVHGMLANAGGSDISCGASDTVAADYVVDPADWPGQLTTRSNIRSGPGPDYTILSTLDGGTPVQVTGAVRNTDWLQVEMGASSVFVHGSLVTRAEFSATVVKEAATDEPGSVKVKTWMQPVCVRDDGDMAMTTSADGLDREIRRGYCVGIVEIRKTATCDTRTARCAWPCGDVQCWSEWTNEPKWPYSSYADEARAVAETASADPQATKADGLTRVTKFRQQLMADAEDDAAAPALPLAAAAADRAAALEAPQADQMQVETWKLPQCVDDEGRLAPISSAELYPALQVGVCVGIVEIAKTATCDTRTSACEWPCRRGDTACYEAWTDEPSPPYLSYEDDAKAVAAAARADPESARADGMAKLEEFHAFLRSAEPRHETSQEETAVQETVEDAVGGPAGTTAPDGEDIAAGLVQTEPKCALKRDDTPWDAVCWWEFTRPSGCFFRGRAHDYTYTDELRYRHDVTWSGVCKGGVATGEGTFTSTLVENVYGHPEFRGPQILQTGKGRFVDGVKQDEWVEDLYPGSPGHWIQTGTYLDGRPHGHWVMQRGVHEDSYVHNQCTFEGAMVRGREHGEWIERCNNGLCRAREYVDGETINDWPC